MKQQSPDLDVLTVYRTAEGRECLVVFEGPEEGPLLPWTNRLDGTVRIGYLQPDGNAGDMIATEYAWYPGVLTPVRHLDGFFAAEEEPEPATTPQDQRVPVAVVFKAEDEVDGEPVGPVGYRYAEENPPALIPYDPNRTPAPWLPRSQAVAMAAAERLPFIES